MYGELFMAIFSMFKLSTAHYQDLYVNLSEKIKSHQLYTKQLQRILETIRIKIIF